MNQKIAIAVIGGLFAVGLVLAFEFGRSSRSDAALKESEQTNFEEGWGGEEPEGTKRSDSASNLAPLETLVTDPSHPHVQFLNPSGTSGVSSIVLVGAPGIWPPATLTTDARGSVYLPDTDVETLRGEAFGHFEVMARASKKSLAFWGSLDFGGEGPEGKWPQKRVALEAASDVRVSVKDADGRPVSDAEIRLSRQRIGFVSLTKRTSREGSGRFRAIPAGEFVVSARHRKQGEGEEIFDHAAGETSKLTIKLDPSRRPPVPKGTQREFEVGVRLDGLSESSWRSSHLQWRRRGGAWQLATLHPTGRSGERRWRRRLKGGTYQLRVSARDGTQSTRRIQVGKGATEFDWSIDLERRVKLYVVDDFGSPVSGALVQVWAGKKLVDSKLSKGNQPVTVAMNAEGSYRAVAIAPRRGEAERTVDPNDVTGEVVLRVDEPLFSSSRPPSRVRQPKRIEKILGVPVVNDGESWLLDAVDSESLAVESGLKRGDRLMSLHRNENGSMEAIVERDGQVISTPLKAKK